MAIIVKISDIVIPDSDLVSVPVSQEGAKLDKSNLLAGSLDIVIDNSANTYSQFISTSIFFGSEFYGDEVTIYDDVVEVFTFKGTIKNIIQDSKSEKTTVKAKNQLRNIKSHILSYAAGSGTNVTGAEHMLNIIRDEVGIPEDNINVGSFTTADNIQIDEAAYIILTYTTDNGNNALSVLNELERITNTFLYVVNNKISISQWTEYTGDLGFAVNDEFILPGTFKVKSLDQVINAYSIAYDDGGGAVLYAPTDYGDSLVASQAQFGTRTFNFPKENIESTVSAEFRILPKSLASAKWMGNTIIDRYIDLIMVFDLILSGEMGFLHAYNQIDITGIEDLVGEPAIIKTLKFEQDKDTVTIQGEFSNIPNERFARDVIPPVSPELISVFSLANGTVLVKWTKSVETDHIGYHLYFATSPGVWKSETSNLGQSAVRVVNPSETPDGYVYAILGELSQGVPYYFKVSSFDSSLNESEFSNILSCIPNTSLIENIYMLQGDPFGASLTLDDDNGLAGTVPDEFETYGDSLYGAGLYGHNAIYESPLMTSPSTWSSIKLRGVGTVMYFQWRESDDGDFGDWTTAVSMIGITEIALDIKSFQYRIMFGSNLWTDSDFALVKELT